MHIIQAWLYYEKVVFTVLLILLIVLQIQFWFGHGGYRDNKKLVQQIAQQQEIVQELQARNDALKTQVNALKQSPETLEMKARQELNLIKKNETLVIIPPGN